MPLQVLLFSRWASQAMALECPRRTLKWQLNVALWQVMNPANSSNLKALQLHKDCFWSDAGSLDIWSVTTQSVPDVIMKFFLSTILDTLPHDKIWWNGERHSARDQLGPCGGKQALLHVLNYCDMAQHQRISSGHIFVGCKIGRTTSCGLCQAAFVLSDLQLDIIVWNQESGVAYLLELVVWLSLISSHLLSKRWLDIQNWCKPSLPLHLTSATCTQSRLDLLEWYTWTV